MKIKLRIGYMTKSIAIIINCLFNKINKLKAEIDRILHNKGSEPVGNFESLIVTGPVMSEEKYSELEDNRKHFSQWRAN